MPKGKYDVGLFAQVGTPDPGLCVVFCSKNIPSKANAFGGQNTTRTEQPDDRRAVDDGRPGPRPGDPGRGRSRRARPRSPTTRRRCPLYQPPTIFVYDKTKIGGNVQDNTVMGPFFTHERVDPEVAPTAGACARSAEPDRFLAGRP